MAVPTFVCYDLQCQVHRCPIHKFPYLPLGPTDNNAVGRVASEFAVQWRILESNHERV